MPQFNHIPQTTPSQVNPDDTRDRIADWLRCFHHPTDQHRTIFIATARSDRTGCAEGVKGKLVDWKTESFDNADLAAAHAANYATTHNIYFTHTHTRSGARSREGAGVGGRSFCMDVDVKEGGYANTKEAREAGHAFCAALARPPTFIVDSGSGGLQLYWLWQDVLGLNAWKNISQRLAAAGRYHGLKFDAACTTDAVRIMRIPGTNNFNYGPPLPVTIITKGTGYQAAGFATALMPSQYDVPADPAEAAARKTTTKFLRKIGLDPKVFCGQLSKSLAERGANDSYPVWWPCLQFAGALDEPERTQLALQLSDGHPRFSEEATLAKLNQTKHPPTCASFNDARPGICTKCPDWGRIRSPISLIEHKPIHTPDRQHAIDAEIKKFRDSYTSRIGSVVTPATARAALAAVDVALHELKERDADLARECAYRLMALLSSWEWGESTVRRAGILAGLSEGQAARWAFKLFATKEFERTNPFAIKRNVP